MTSASAIAPRQGNQYAIPETMQAWVLGGPEELSLVEKPPELVTGIVAADAAPANAASGAIRTADASGLNLRGWRLPMCAALFPGVSVFLRSLQEKR